LRPSNLGADALIISFFPYGLFSQVAVVGTAPHFSFLVFAFLALLFGTPREVIPSARAFDLRCPHLVLFFSVLILRYSCVHCCLDLRILLDLDFC
jgi:hypothetical protein